MTLVTSLKDAATYPAAEIADLYKKRWNVELDIRHIKQTLHLEQMSCKNPAMVAKEFWVTLLAYNLIRKVMADAASQSGVLPRRLSFSGACTIILTIRMRIKSYRREKLLRVLKSIGKQILPERPYRFDPRVLKKRQGKKYPLMNRPRNVLKNEMCQNNSEKNSTEPMNNNS